MKTRIFGCLFGFAAFHTFIACGQNPVVTVVIQERSGVQDFGGGFVSSPKGEVLTCYHVVEGAVRIRVFYAGKFYDAKATGIAPDRDIARLEMIRPPVPTQFLKTSTLLPANVSTEQLHIVGYALGLFDQRVPAQVTQDSFAVSQQLKDQHGDSLFATTAVRLKVEQNQLVGVCS